MGFWADFAKDHESDFQEDCFESFGGGNCVGLFGGCRGLAYKELCLTCPHLDSSMKDELTQLYKEMEKKKEEKKLRREKIRDFLGF